jgi:glycosyltransferase involved in cell wall biosynthesis
MEAMACGLPVVSTHLSGIPELVTHGVEGYLTQPGDVDAIAEGLKTLAASAEERQKLGHAARKKILSEFELESNARRLLAVIEDKL